MAVGLGGVVGIMFLRELTGVFRLSSGTKVGLGVLVAWIVGAVVAVGLAAGLARSSESPPKVPQLSVKNSAKNANTVNLDTI